MRYLVIRNEESIRDVVKKAYKRLTTNQLKQAESALLKTNPELKTFASVPMGTIVRVPSTLNDRKLDHRNLVSPIDDITREMEEKLKLLEDSLLDKFDKLENRQKDTVAILKSAKKELKLQPNGDAVAKALMKHITDSKKLNTRKKKLWFEALEKLHKNAAAFNR